MERRAREHHGCGRSQLQVRGRPWLWWLSATVLCVLVVCVEAAGVEVQAQSTCRFLVDGKLLNLEPLAQLDGHPRFETKFGPWSFTYNPCLSYNKPLDPHHGHGSGCYFVSICKFGYDPFRGNQSEEWDSSESWSVSLEETNTVDHQLTNKTDDENINNKEPVEHVIREQENDDDDEVEEQEEVEEEDEEEEEEEAVEEDENEETESEKETENERSKRAAGQAHTVYQKHKRWLKKTHFVYRNVGIHRSVQIRVVTRSIAQANTSLSASSSPSSLGATTDTPSDKNDSVSYDISLIYRGFRSTSKLTSEVRLICDWNRTGELDGLFFVTNLTKVSAHFELHHLCCCLNGCLRSDIYRSFLPSMFLNGYNFSGNGSADAGEEYIFGFASPPAPKFMWIILLVNFGLFVVAVGIGALCFRKGKGNAQYVNMLPALNVSQLSLNENNPHDRMFMYRSREKLEYTIASDKSSKKGTPLLDNCLIPAVVLDIGQRLGGGLFGDTYKATWNGKNVAVKRFTVGVHQTQLSEANYLWLENEIAELSKQRHQNLVSLMGVCFETKQPYLVNEHVSETSVKEVIKTISGDFTWTQIFKICIQVSEGMTYLHSAKTPILHRDLRCANLLIDVKDRVKISDFGVMKLVQKLRQECHNVGCFCQKEFSAVPASVRWTAPEILLNPESDEGQGIVTTKCDVFSFGMIIFELITKVDPFDQFEVESEVSEMVKEGYRPALPQDVDLLPALPELIYSCWDEEPRRRPPFKQVTYDLKELMQAAKSMEKQARKDARFTGSSSHILDITT